MRFVEIQSDLWVNLEHVVAVRKLYDDTQIFVTGHEVPFTVRVEPEFLMENIWRHERDMREEAKHMSDKTY